MPADMLVKLYELPELETKLNLLRQNNIQIIRGMAPIKGHISKWVLENFDIKWASELEVAFSRSPVSAFIALRDQEILGFSCHDVTSKGFFGPVGVGESARGLGIGYALLLRSLYDLHEMGYAYAVIGAAGPVEFYKKAVNAIEIPDSFPGIFEPVFIFDN